MNDTNGIDEFMSDFYSAVSSAPGATYSGIELKSLFDEKAVLIESGSEGYQRRTIEQHVEEMSSVFTQYDFLIKYGFEEKEAGRSVLNGDDIFLIESAYSKKYHNGTRIVEEGGTNFLSVIRDGDSFKIISIIW